MVSILIVLELPLWHIHAIRQLQSHLVSILIVLELPLWLLETHQMPLAPPGFNPYCSGITAVADLHTQSNPLPIWFQSLLFWNYRCGDKMSETDLKVVIVSILIVLELPLWLSDGEILLNGVRGVSILIVLELPLWLPQNAGGHSAAGSFNPYCSGITAVAPTSDDASITVEMFQSLLFWNYRCGAPLTT